MLKDLIFIYYLSAYSSGIIALIFSVFLYLNRKNILIKKYIFVLISLLAVIAFGTISNYFPQKEKYIMIKSSLNFIMYTSTCLLIFVMPGFINELIDFYKKKIINNTFLVLGIIMFVILLIFFIINKIQYAHYLIMSGLGIATVYSIAAILINIKKISRDNLFFFMKHVAVISIILFPLFIIFDYYRLFFSESISGKGPLIMPFLFFIWNILFIISALTHLSNRQQTGLEISAEFLSKYGISKREKEIIELLLNGLSYKEIMEKLSISMPTVKTHVTNIYTKTNTNSKMKLVHLLKNESL